MIGILDDLETASRCEAEFFRAKTGKADMFPGRNVVGFLSCCDSLSIFLQVNVTQGKLRVVVDVDEVASGFSASVTLPSYTLVNAGMSYEAEDWSFNLTVKNLTDERYFRSNFPDLFGSQIVLPELPRHWNAKFTYKF